MQKRYLPALILCALLTAPAIGHAASSATSSARPDAVQQAPQAKPVRLSPCNNYAVEVYFDIGQM